MDRSPATILVVDDDVRTRTLLRSYLEEMGFSAIFAEDGSRLEHTLATRKVDLLVLDLMLPGEDGLSLCRRIRGNGMGVPIIMLTAKGNEIDRIVGLGRGRRLPTKAFQSPRTGRSHQRGASPETRHTRCSRHGRLHHELRNL
jgi:DNA-binding response OmpR family regulator